MSAHRLAAILSNHIPDGYQLEIRHDDAWPVTTFRYTRIHDEVWCQEVVEDVLAEQASSLEAVADEVLRRVAHKLA